MILGSLRARLRWLILLMLVLVLVPLSVLSFHRTLVEVDELLDGRLAQSARTLLVLIEHADLETLRAAAGQEVLVPIAPARSALAGPAEPTHESEVGFQILDGSGQVVLATANLKGLAAPLRSTTHYRDVRMGGHSWRIFTLASPVDGMLIRTGERYDSRHEIMQALWFDIGLPVLVGLPLLAFLIGWALQRGLRPLELLTRRLALRELGSRAPVTLEHPPRELQPVLAALNDQLQRLADALERERRFSADVAHELRTPLASTMINLESALATADPAEAATSLGSAQHVLAALARRVEQLLVLARLESGAAAQQAPVDLVAVASDVIEELAPAFADDGVELGFVPPSEPVILHGYEAALAALLRNLIENAMRHVPAGGQVQVSIAPGSREVVIDVIDDGSGIPAERRAQVFARFHREDGGGEGYGLGLSIVQRAAQLHGATIELLDSPFGRGLRVRVTIPRGA